MRSVVFIIAIIILNLNIANAQKENKVLQWISSEATFVNLKKNLEILQGGENPVSRFLEKSMRSPQAVPLKDFQDLKSKYYKLVDTYNGIVDSMISKVRTINSLASLKTISFTEYEGYISELNTRFQGFYASMAKYHNEAAIAALLIPVLNEVGGQLIKYFKDMAIEKLQVVVITELQKLKLTRIPWEPAEEVIKSDSPVSQSENIKEKIDYSENDYLKTLCLKPGSSKEAVDQKYDSLATVYKQFESSENEDIKEFFAMQKVKLNEAKKYLDTKFAQSGVKTQATNVANDSNCRQEEMKGAIKAIIMLSKSNGQSKEELIQSLELILKDY
ncbi:MAG: hypothetical protein A2W91_01655 [Bacteroidetes bacterium GWF2_38_335]|nr:MAG: hypothetical protein A2W91_01655 [Bacteroidetes bacterium GWF2_38_335]OFY78775.1 MAG: hypothetical protein A2281_19230 [Bacteroidetes bacterium RIFOXYA12_FULL_38_20]HBS85169.1 hypothetical protein [Bacteroidales bacterium]